jgi:hypothetical protein
MSRQGKASNQPFPHNAVKLLERMRRSKAGWRPRHYERLFMGFGFEARQGGEHTIYYDLDDPDNSVSVPRHRELKPYLAGLAVAAVVRKLDRLKETE